MKIRIKFRKYGIMKFIGHLDMMRYFQKAIRRAGIDICYSEGFSPHMIMSFASPLGVGLTSDGEYLDIEVRQTFSSEESIRRLNDVMAEGVEVVSFRKIPEGKASNAMALTAAADYEVRFREGCGPKNGWQEAFDGFCALESIPMVKKSKKGEREVDIRPLIYALRAHRNASPFGVDGLRPLRDGIERQEDSIFMQVATGSTRNLKPELVMEAFSSWAGLEFPESAFLVHRLEVYADIGMEEKRQLISLESLGEDIK